jgi:hypothetical protein
MIRRLAELTWAASRKETRVARKPPTNANPKESHFSGGRTTCQTKMIRAFPDYGGIGMLDQQMRFPAMTLVVTSGDVNVSVASHLPKLPLRGTVALLSGTGDAWRVSRLRRLVGIIEELSFTTVRERLIALILRLAQAEGEPSGFGGRTRHGSRTGVSEPQSAPSRRYSEH